MTQRYDTYKDSGVQWLGEIPRHWGLIKMKYLFNERSEKNHPDEEPLCATQKYGVIPQKLYISYGNRVVVVNKGFEQLKFVKVGDFVIHLRSFQGGIEYAYYQGISSAAYTILYPKDAANTQYFKNLFKSSKYIELLKTCVTGIREGQNINYPLLSTKQIPLPPLSEQHSIVSYLDDRCGKIDKMLEGKQKQIELLAEMKQRIIADAVTRGLNPDVKMKATNIPWLPEIPEHWELRKMKYLFRERSEKNHPAEPMLSATQTHGVILQSKYSGRVVVVNTGFEGLKLVKVGDFVIHLRSFQGGIELAHDQGIISSAYTVLSLNDSTQSDYFRYLFKSIPFIDLLKTCVTGIREGQNINYAKLKQNRIPLPPLDEQHAIVSYITDKTSKIDTLTSKLQQEIESIKEYKQRLISDVVTGQIKVC